MESRRSFLRMAGTGLVASATMAQAGMLAEFLDWLRRKPVWSFPSPVDPSLVQGVDEWASLQGYYMLRMDLMIGEFAGDFEEFGESVAAWEHPAGGRTEITERQNGGSNADSR